jgi:hypothetical protein
MAPAVFPTIFGLIVVGLFLAVIVTAVILTATRAGKTLVAACLVVPLLLLGLLCFGFLLARPSMESATVEQSFGPAHEVPERELIPLEPPAAAPVPAAPAASAPSGPVAGDVQAPYAPATDAAPPSQATPIRTQTAGAARPAWMDQPTGYREGAYRTITTAGPYSTPQECNQKLNDALNEAIHNYVDRFMSQRVGNEIELPPAFIHERIVRGEWLEQSEYSAVGPMYNLHALLVFDRGVNQELERRYRESQISGRLASTGAGAAIVLGLIATLFGYLKLDTLTRGYYTGRLRAAAATAILALATIAGLLVHGNIGF